MYFKKGATKMNTSIGIYLMSIASVTIGIAGAVVYAVALAWLLASVYAVILRIQHRHCALFESRRQNVAFEEMTHCAMWWVILLALPLVGRAMHLLCEVIDNLV